MAYRDILVADTISPSSDPGPAPMLQWVDIADLVIDETYQRPLLEKNWAHIRRIATGFRWSLFAPVLVAPVEGGKFAIIDGQHRAHAAALIGIAKVPAQCVLVPIAEQAKAFAGVNQVRMSVSMPAVFRAALAAQEDWALRADAAVREAGLALATSMPSSRNRKPGVIYSVNSIRRFTDKGKHAEVVAGLSALRVYDGGTGRVALYHDYVLSPWLAAVTSDARFAKADLVAVLCQRDPFKVLEAAGSSGTVSRASAAVDFFAAMIRRQAGIGRLD